MSQFEFVLVGSSMVIALAVARLLEGTRDSFEPGRRYWLHASWVVIKLMNSVMIFWGAWAYGMGDDAYSFVDFLIVVGAPGVLYLQAHALIGPRPDSVPDWRAHFWKIRRWFFAANVALIALVGATIYVVGDTPFPSIDAVPIAVILTFSALGVASSNERLHGAIAVVALLNLTLGFGTRLMLGAP